MSIQHAVILAAGRGARMVPLTDEVPKPMAPFGDSTLIADGIAKLRKHIEKLHITVGYKGAMLSQHLIELGVSTILNTEGKNNTWWIYHSLLSQLDEPVFVLTCDNITDIDFPSLDRDYIAQGSPACMVVPVAPVSGLDGDYIFHDGKVVTALNRHKPAPTYCSGIQVLNPKAVQRLAPAGGEFTEVWAQLIAKRQLFVSSVRPSKWFSVDTVADLKRYSTATGK
jgi:N-acetyl-alpha-D-muramate 1-phosphate uridylyltransferase